MPCNGLWSAHTKCYIYIYIYIYIYVCVYIMQPIHKFDNWTIMLVARGFAKNDLVYASNFANWRHI